MQVLLCKSNGGKLENMKIEPNKPHIPYGPKGLSDEAGHGIGTELFPSH
jgi:hypothetical protein